MKFKSGYSYIVKGKTKYWYIVKQTGMKSWKALMISHVDAMAYSSEFYEGNGVSLPQKLEVTEYRAFKENRVFRQTLFNVLKYGDFKEA